MFIKAFRVKSSVQLKSSEKKKFRGLVERCFSSHPEISEVLGNKANITLTRLLPHDTSLGMIQVHCIDKTPMFVTLERDEIPIPTVYTLWKIPDLLPRVVVPLNVLDRLVGGADVMLPGILPYSLATDWSAGDVVSVCSPESGAAMAVGIWAVGRADAAAGGMKGRGVIVYQVYLDQLWHYGPKDKRPLLPPPVYHQPLDPISAVTEALEVTAVEEDSTVEPDEGPSAPTDTAEPEEEEEEEVDKDALLLEACYRALKTSVKKADLPILTSTFYSQHVRGCCEQPVEIKQTRWKKLSALLKELQDTGLLVVKEQKKGVQSVTAVDFSHVLLRGVKKLEKEEEEDDEDEDIAVAQAFTCNAHATKFFSQFGFKKGDILTRKQIRTLITSYIRTQNLVDPAEKSKITLDPLLSDLTKTREVRGQWNTVMQRAEAACGKCYVIALPGRIPITVKGELPPIRYKVEKRTGNKQVTLISNFAIFGIEAKELAQKLQLLQSSSATVVAGVKGEEVLVQGDARKHATKLLLQEYKIPKTFVSSS